MRYVVRAIIAPTLTVVVLLGASPLANAQCCEESADIEHANNTQASEEFGASVAVLGNDVVVGAPKHDAGGESNVGRIVTFPLDDPADQDTALAEDRDPDWAYGTSVALTSDFILVGASGADVDLPAFGAGAVYVLDRNDDLDEIEKLDADDSAQAGAEFGRRIAVSERSNGDVVLVVAAPREDLGEDTDAGAVYVFKYSGTSWTEEDRIFDGGAAALFGWDVAIDEDGDRLIVGAPNAGASHEGRAYVYTFSGSSWSQQEVLSDTQGDANDEFGWSVAIYGDHVLVGAPFDDGAGAAGAREGGNRASLRIRGRVMGRIGGDPGLQHRHRHEVGPGRRPVEGGEPDAGRGRLPGRLRRDGRRSGVRVPPRGLELGNGRTTEPFNAR
jgi:hypothetical protein